MRISDWSSDVCSSDLIGPNRIHYWWIPEWKRAFPDAGVWLAPRIRERAGARIAFDAHPLDAGSGYPWDGAISTLPVTGSFMTEVEFFHHASRTLVLTDFIENFERDKLGRDRKSTSLNSSH